MIKHCFAVTTRSMLIGLSLVALFASTVCGQTDNSSKRTVPFEARYLRVVALRLKPGQDLRREIEELVKARHIRAGFIITTVGSLSQAAMRLADQSSTTRFEGKFEIVSLVGTLGPDGVHLHISISDSTGRTIGGHLVEGCAIYTTAEIVIGEARGLIFARGTDPETGYKELQIRKARR
jgi:predicted DNA-binding protein with PD1-like motif